MPYRLATLPRFQFALRGMLLATFWAAVWLAVCVAPFTFTGGDTLFFYVMAYRVVGPFIAIGALFGRTWIGAAVGLAVLGAVAVFDYVYIMQSDTFP